MAKTSEAQKPQIIATAPNVPGFIRPPNFWKRSVIFMLSNCPKAARLTPHLLLKKHLNLPSKIWAMETPLAIFAKQTPIEVEPIYVLFT